MASANHRGTGIFRRSVSKRLSPEFKEALDGLPGVPQLKRVGERPRLGSYLADLWDRRLFIYVGARGEASTSHSRDRLGLLWLIIRPLLDAVFYYVIFALLLKVDRGMDNFVAWLLVGLFMFQFTTRSITAGVGLIRGSKAMIRAFTFPRASLAISNVTRELLLAIPSFATMLVLIAVIPPHALPTPLFLLMVPLLAVQLLVNLGLVLVLARVGALLPDFARLMSFIQRVLFYGSGVIIPILNYELPQWVERIVTGNPLFVMLEMYRSILVYGEPPAAGDWLYFLAWAVGAFLVGFVVFWWAEESYGRE
ncbi:ABC transporter permease [Agrococcus casei]|uniref:ABC transporter permease n=1 Tax=Agrococcus casei TaxID=343512 RepID=UPI003F8DCCEC